MKLLLILLCCLSQQSCVNRPSITTHHSDGSWSRTTLGGTFAAEADEVLASLKTPEGLEMKYAAKREDGTRVLGKYVEYLLGKVLAITQGKTEDLKTVTDGRVASETISAGVAKEEIAAGVTKHGTDAATAIALKP